MAYKIASHPDVAKYLNSWLQIDDLVDGSLCRVARYLLKYATEEVNHAKAQAHYTQRLARLVYDNLCDPILTIHLAHLSQKVTWGGLQSDKFVTIRDNASGMGENAESVAREIIYNYLKDGLVGVLVDAPADASLPSYQVVYPAISIRNWQRFTSGPKRGQFKSICLQEHPFIGADNKAYDQVRIVEYDDDQTYPTYKVLRASKEKTYLDLANASRATTAGELLITNFCDHDYELVETGQLSIDVIPFEMIGCGMPESVLKDVYQDARSIMNKTSAKDNILYYQAFQRVLGAGMKAEEIDKWSESIIAIAQDPSANIQTIEPANPAALDADIERAKARALRKGLMQHNQLVEDTRQVQSAESKTKDMVARIKFYDQTLDMLERKLHTIYGFHALFENEELPELNIKFVRDYGLEDTSIESTEDALVYSQAGQLGVVELQREVLRKYVAKMQIVARQGQSEEQRRQELLAVIDSAQGYNRASALPGATQPAQFQRTTMTDALSDGGQSTARN